MNKYEMTKVYVVENDLDGDFYVGSTTYQYLSDRMNAHRQASKNDTERRQSLLNRKMREFDLEHFKIRLLETYPCQTKEEQLLREQFWIDHLQPPLNERKTIETRTPQEINRERYVKEKDVRSDRGKRYYVENAEEIKARVRAYAEANKDLIKERSKKYREEHKEELKAKKSATITCECGGQTTAGHLARHKKSKKHLEYINKA